MNAEEALEKFERLWIYKEQPPLNETQKLVFLGMWHNKKFSDLAEIYGYQEQTLRAVGSDFFYPKIQKVFSLSYKIKKNNFQSTIKKILDRYEPLLSQDESRRDLNPEPELNPVAENSQSDNPFIPLTGRVDDPQLFFGREKEISEIFELLNSSSNVAAIGERAIGKSSLLKAIERAAPSQLGQWRKPVYLTLQEVDNEEEFYSYLCDEVEIDECSGYQLNRQLKKQRLLLLLDEVDKMSGDGFTHNVRDKLRSLAEGIDAPLRLIMAARISLDDLFKEDTTLLTSPLANICVPVNLGPWDETTARAFIAQRLASTEISFTEEEISQIIAETGGHPQQLMQRCHKTYADYLEKNSDR